MSALSEVAARLRRGEACSLAELEAAALGLGCRAANDLGATRIVRAWYQRMGYLDRWAISTGVISAERLVEEPALERAESVRVLRIMSRVLEARTVPFLEQPR